VDGTRHVIEAVRAAGVHRLIHCSSVAATAIGDGTALVTEDDAWNLPAFGLDDTYSISKRESEDVVRAAVNEGLDAVIVNPTYMIGPLDSKPSSGRLVIGLMHRKVPGYTEGSNNFVDVRAVAKGMVLAWKRGRRGERYILGDRNLTYREFMELVARIAGVDPPARRVPQAIARVFGIGGDLLELVTRKEVLINSMKVAWSECPGFRFSSEKAKRELDYDPGDLERAIRDAIEWFRSHGMA
jgi:dihydroflavonol-4-reductase